MSDLEMIGDHYPFTLSQKKEGKNRWKKTHHVTFFIYHTTYIPLNNNTYNIITPHMCRKILFYTFHEKKNHTCKNEFYWTIVGYSLLVLVHFWMSNQPKEFFVFDTMFLPPKNKQIYSMWEKTYPPSQSVFPAKKN